MRFRPLGRTGLSVSVIGFGASALGNVFGAVPLEQGRAAVNAAIDHGVNLFDVSPYYGLTLAEDRLGDALKSRRKDILLATKCGRYGASDFDFSAQAVTRGFESSLQRLKTDYVDLLQVHDVEFGSAKQIIEETLPALRRLQEQGKTRFIGITGYWPALLARLAREVPVDTVLNYCHWNLLIDDMDGDLTPFAQQAGVGLMNASPLHMGLLGGGPVPDWHPAPAAIRQVATSVVVLCREHGVNPATLALWACLQHPFAASTFVGSNSVEQIEQSLSALDYVPAPELLAQVRQLIAPVFNTVWPSGLPENMPAEVAHAG